MHVIPVKVGIELLPPQTRHEDPAILADHAKRMISALGG
jgi:histidine triad (HIT) family protein